MARRSPARATPHAPAGRPGNPLAGSCRGHSAPWPLLRRLPEPRQACRSPDGLVPLMYAGIAVTALVVLSATAARLVKDLLVVRLIRTLARDGTLSPGQRS